MQLGIVEVCNYKEKLHNSAGTSLLLKTEVEAANKGVSSALQLTTEKFSRVINASTKSQNTEIHY